MEFLAHLKPDSAVQTVEAHCCETAGLAAQYGEKTGLRQTAALAAYLHDIGKLTADFNTYIRNPGSFRRGELDHSFVGAKYLHAAAGHGTDKTARLIGRVILSHHGLHDWVNADAADTYQQRIGKTERYAEILRNLEAADWIPPVQQALEQAAAEVMPIRAVLRKLAEDAEIPKEAFACYLGMLERLLQSVLIDADRTNTADFMSGTQTEIHPDTVRLWQEMQQRMQAKLDSFAQKTDPISLQRRSISDRCAAFARNDVRICKLIVPTGGGKTLSSLRFAIAYANRHPIDRIFYIAPFMSILEQNSDVIRQIAGEAAFLEHHSDMLAEISEQDERLQEYELRTEKWDAPVIATTMVQFLNALFSGKSGDVRRMHRLSRAVILIDEVQSVPLKCVYLFNLAMNFFSQICGSTVILCSATQPPFDLLKAFPLKLDAVSSMTGDTAADFAAFRRTKLIWQEKKGGYSYDEAAAFCTEQFRLHGSLLTVVNTKAAAKELYQRMKDTPGAAVYHLSTNMCPQHRRTQIAAMKQALAAHEPVICVTTQLIEAGVDISFGCVVRSLAGMDNAAQAAGRCNRSGEYQRECPVFILKLWEESLGSLSEIKEAQAISAEMLSAQAEADFLSVPVMSDYFGKLYRSAQNRNHRDLLRYALPNPTDRDLLNLLSHNSERINGNRNPHLQFCGQAFRTAGRLFQVIDSDTTNVIVPYNEEAEELILRLGSEDNPAEAVKLLRKAQKYAVSLYAGAKQKLDGEAAITSLACGRSGRCTVQILDKRFYHPDFGVTTEGSVHEVLFL